MFIIRRAKMEDAATLLKLAKMVHFINLPADNEIIAGKIVSSRSAFLRAAGKQSKAAPKPRVRNGDVGLGESVSATDLFFFVLEDTDNPGCLGTSQLVAQMGGPGRPNVCFKLERREKYSETLKTGTSNVVARLHLDESGPTEIGGLILQPSFRSHPHKLGKFLSLVRFHFVGLHRAMFRDKVLAEMMAPITPDGHNLLWDYLGRRFIPLSYQEADRFCQYSREFMTALLPHGDIHLSLLPPEARSVVGKVGPETVPARRMLERLGFVYDGFVDPFDGGPFLTATTSDIEPVRVTRRLKFGGTISRTRAVHRGIVSVLDNDGEFTAVQEPFLVQGNDVFVPKDVAHALQMEHATYVGVTILEGPSTTKTTAVAVRKKKATARKKSSTRKKTSRKRSA